MYLNSYIFQMGDDHQAATMSVWMSKPSVGPLGDILSFSSFNRYHCYTLLGDEWLLRTITKHKYSGCGGERLLKPVIQVLGGKRPKIT